MYHPYYRGKQFELIAIREQARLIAQKKMCPIIEPVKKNLSSLKRTITKLKEKSANFILIANPKCGEMSNGETKNLEELIDEDLTGYGNACIGYIVDGDSEISEVKAFLQQTKKRNVAIIHYGYSSAKILSNTVKPFGNIKKHIFIDGKAGKLYRKKFSSKSRVLIRDGFNKRDKNADYPPVDPFSDLHITYTDEGMDGGFGDFLIVGDNYSKTGGPAYSVAIHLTFLGEDDEMFTRHFLSDTNNTYADPGGKFLEALNNMYDAENNDEIMYKSSAYDEFMVLRENARFPGLGYVKKLSMIHHVELMANSY